MKILAPFDGTAFSESTMPLVKRICGLPGAEVSFLRVAHEPSGKPMRGVRKSYTSVAGLGSTPLVFERPQSGYAEIGEQAVERKLGELEEYLRGLAKQLPDPTKVHIQAHIYDGHEGPAQLIVEQARDDGTDVIVMATHSRGGIRRALFGSTTEAVIKSGVAPVLVVHPTEG